MADYSDYTAKEALCQSQLGLANTLTMGSQVTLKGRMEQALAKAKAEVTRIEEIIQLLEKNPEVNRLLELMGRGGF